MNIGYKIDTEKVRKQNKIDLLNDQPLQTLQIAYLYAKNFISQNRFNTPLVIRGRVIEFWLS